VAWRVRPSCAELPFRWVTVSSLWRHSPTSGPNRMLRRRGGPVAVGSAWVELEPSPRDLLRAQRPCRKAAPLRGGPRVDDRLPDVCIARDGQDCRWRGGDRAELLAALPAGARCLGRQPSRRRVQPLPDILAVHYLAHEAGPRVMRDVDRQAFARLGVNDAAYSHPALRLHRLRGGIYLEGSSSPTSLLAPQHDNTSSVDSHPSHLTSCSSKAPTHGIQLAIDISTRHKRTTASVAFYSRPKPLSEESSAHGLGAAE
jgi:hypothetical protein